jgi:hypothetical protein
VTPIFVFIDYDSYSNKTCVQTSGIEDLGTTKVLQSATSRGMSVRAFHVVSRAGERKVWGEEVRRKKPEGFEAPIAPGGDGAPQRGCRRGAAVRVEGPAVHALLGVDETDGLELAASP